MIINSTEFMTGIPLIDEQHKQYIILVNKFIAKHNKGLMPLATLSDYVNEVVAYALEHFDAEEAFMRSEDYPLYEEHLEKHNLFRDKMDEFIEELEVKELDINDYVDRLCKWLIDWFKLQVLDDDVKLAMFIQGEHRHK